MKLLNVDLLEDALAKLESAMTAAGKNIIETGKVSSKNIWTIHKDFDIVFAQHNLNAPYHFRRNLLF